MQSAQAPASHQLPGAAMPPVPTAATGVLDPTVPGKIVWLRPANAASARGDKCDVDAQAFEPCVIDAAAPALRCVRLAPASLEDHFLGRYRDGLGMPPRDTARAQSGLTAGEDGGRGGGERTTLGAPRNAGVGDA